MTAATTQTIIHKYDYTDAAAFYSTAMIGYATASQIVSFVSKIYSSPFISTYETGLKFSGVCLLLHVYSTSPEIANLIGLVTFIFFGAMNLLVSRYTTQPIKEDFLRNLNEEMKDKPHSLVMDERRIQEVVDALDGVHCTNCLLVGNTGCGKSTLMEGIAWMIEHDKFPKDHFFYGKKIYSLELNSLIAETKYRGTWEEKVMRLIHASKGGIILFIDEFHRIFTIGNSSNDKQSNLGELLKKDIVKDVMIVGGTTPADLQTCTRDSAVMRRFNQVIMRLFSIDECKQVLNSFTREEKFKKVYPRLQFSEEVIQAIVEFSYLAMDPQNPKAVVQPSLAITLCEKVAKEMRKEKKTTMTIDLLVKVFTSFSDKNVTNLKEKFSRLTDK